MRKLALLAAASFAATSTAASAQIQNLGYFPQNGSECSGGSFESCFASASGVNIEGANESSTIYKFGSDAATDYGSFASIDGSEFVVTYTSAGNQLSFTYTPNDATDPAIHYFAIFQGGDPVGGVEGSGPGYQLFYSASDITTDTLSLSNYFQNPGFSHITFFDTNRNDVPEPATWAMMIAGFGATGFAMRRRRSKALLTQIA
jgi:hypothetical protein